MQVAGTGGISLFTPPQLGRPRFSGFLESPRPSRLLRRRASGSSRSDCALRRSTSPRNYSVPRASPTSSTSPTPRTMREVPYQKWREYNPEDTVRFYGLRLQEVGMIKSDPKKLIAQGTDWRFLNELKKELKA
jgi:hypothetical protein